jgi:hypothetical protein
MRYKDYITEEKSSIEHMNDLLSKVLTPTNYEHVFDVPIEMWQSLPAIDAFFTSLVDGSVEWGFVTLYELNASFTNVWEWKTNHPDLVPEIYFNSYIAKLRGTNLSGFCQYMLVASPTKYDSGPDDLTKEIVWNLMIQDKIALDDLFGWVGARIDNYSISDIMAIPDKVLKLATSEQAVNILDELAVKSEYIDKYFGGVETPEWQTFVRKVDIIQDRAAMYDET